MKRKKRTETEPLLLQANNWRPDNELNIQLFSYGSSAVSINWKTTVEADTKDEYDKLIDSFINCLCALDTKNHTLQKLISEYNEFSNRPGGKLHSSDRPYSCGWKTLDYCCGTLVNGCFIFFAGAGIIVLALAMFFLTIMTLIENFSPNNTNNNYKDILIPATGTAWSIIALAFIFFIWGLCNCMNHSDCCCSDDEVLKLCNISDCCINISPHRDVYIDKNPKHFITRQYKSTCRSYKKSIADLKKELKTYATGDMGDIWLIASITSAYANTRRRAPRSS